MKTPRRLLPFLLPLLAACSGEEPLTPSRPPVPPPSVSSDADGGAGGGSAGDGGTSDCFDAKTSKPSSQSDFLNQCNDHCFAFDNSARIEGYSAGGSLPPLN